MTSNTGIAGVSTLEPPSPAPDRPWRVLIVDDHELFRNGLRDLLASEAGLEICGEAADTHDALRMFRELRPDLVTVDISLAKGNGLSLVEKIRAVDPSITILVISMYDENVYADRAIAAGAAGYLCKQASNAEIREALRILRKKGAYLSRSSMEALVQRGSRDPSAPASEESQLSTRELQIFTMLGQGETTQSIAQNLHISTSTVDTYRERIKSKLNLANGTELVRRAILWVMGHS